MSKIRLLVVGAGGHGRSVLEAAELSGQFEVVGLLDDSLPAGDRVLGLTVLGPVVSMAHHRAGADQAIVAIGNNTVREKLLQQLAAAGLKWATVVHPPRYSVTQCRVRCRLCRYGRRNCGHRSTPGR
jgi:FlaA1/EpsC-like NDP-sugar epimerase